MSTWTLHPDWDNMPIHCFDEIIELPFENISIPDANLFNSIQTVLKSQ